MFIPLNDEECICRIVKVALTRGRAKEAYIFVLLGVWTEALILASRKAKYQRKR